MSEGESLERERAGLSIAVLGEALLEGVSLSRTLAALGHGVWPLAGPDAAHDTLRGAREGLDLLIVDLRDPRTEGLRTLGWLRTKRLLGEAVVWAIASREGPPAADAVAEHPLDRIFPADVSAEEMALRVRELLPVAEPERRARPRVRVRARALLTGTGRTVHGEVLDLSASGLFVRADKQLPPGKAVSLSVELDDGGRPLELTGRVVRVQVSEEEVRGVTLEPGMGIELDEPDGELRRRLDGNVLGRGSA